jgi:hypothetical protein
MIDDIATRLRKVDGILSATVRGDDILSIIATEPAPFDEIGALSDEAEYVEVIVGRSVSDDPARFRSEPGMATIFHNRWGAAVNPEEPRELAEHLGVKLPPTLNALVDGRLGILFATAADAKRYDGIRAGTISPVLAELPCKWSAWPEVFGNKGQ